MDIEIISFTNFCNNMQDLKSTLYCLHLKKTSYSPAGHYDRPLKLNWYFTGGSKVAYVGWVTSGNPDVTDNSLRNEK